MNKENICFDCRKKLGYKRRDNGSHTAQKTKCDECGEIKGILLARHWVKEND